MGSQLSVQQSISFDKLPLTDDIPRVKNSDGSVLYGPIKKKYTFSNGVRFWKVPGYLGDIPILGKCNDLGEYLRSAWGFTALFRKNRPTCWYDNSTQFASTMSNAWTDDYYISVGDRRFYEGLAFGVTEPPRYNAKSPIGRQLKMLGLENLTKNRPAAAGGRRKPRRKTRKSSTA